MKQRKNLKELWNQFKALFAKDNSDDEWAWKVEGEELFKAKCIEAATTKDPVRQIRLASFHDKTNNNPAWDAVPYNLASNPHIKIGGPWSHLLSHTRPEVRYAAIVNPTIPREILLAHVRRLRVSNPYDHEDILSALAREQELYETGQNVEWEVVQLINATGHEYDPATYRQKLEEDETETS